MIRVCCPLPERPVARDSRQQTDVRVATIRSWNRNADLSGLCSTRRSTTIERFAFLSPMVLSCEYFICFSKVTRPSSLDSAESLALSIRFVFDL